jgi:DNA mismatch endonuclease (patch repair protein)
MDHLPPAARSALMSRIRGKNTTPEIVVRKLVHRMGGRFRLHVRKLAGTPDIVLTRRRKIILVHGCFWHHHLGCKRASLPKTRQNFWRRKIEGNTQRDTANTLKLRNAGWKVLVVWECQTRKPTILVGKVSRFLAK